MHAAVRTLSMVLKHCLLWRSRRLSKTFLCYPAVTLFTEADGLGGLIQLGNVGLDLILTFLLRFTLRFGLNRYEAAGNSRNASMGW